MDYWFVECSSSSSSSCSRWRSHRPSKQMSRYVVMADFKGEDGKGLLEMYLMERIGIGIGIGICFNGPLNIIVAPSNYQS